MDSSSSDGVPLLEQDNTITFMHSQFYEAAAKGEIEPFEGYEEPLNRLLTPTKNTLLHVYLTQQTKGSDISTPFVEHVLAKCSLLLRQTNNRGETPLHMAASHGHPNILRCLIASAKTQHQDIESGAGAAKAMLRMENIDKETALHEAVRHNDPLSLEVLIEEDPDHTYSANQLGETPLYLAVEREYRDMVFMIIDKCTSPAYNGPNGRTALHEAVIRNNEEITAKIAEAKKTLVIEVDQQGWTPLHHASHFGHLSIVKLLLECDKSAAYVGDKHGMTPLHIAASRGDKGEKVAFSILEHCPDCHELVDHKGQNVLHFAVLSGSGSLTDHLLKGSNKKDHCYIPSLTNLINRKDVDGNTPLHLLATYCVDSDALIMHPFADKMAVNNNNFTALDVISESTDDHEEGFKGLTLKYMKRSGEYKQSWRKSIKVKDRMPAALDIEGMQRTKTSHMVVAALIATVTFTAGFTIPGGYDDKEGNAIMSGNGAFVTFVITDALALLLSTCALFFYYILEFDELANREKQRYVDAASLFLMLSIFLMLVAFTAAVVAVLTSTYLKIFVCVIGSFSLVICYSPLKFLFTHL